MQAFRCAQQGLQMLTQGTIWSTSTLTNLPGAQKGYAEGAKVDIKVTLQKGGVLEAQEVAAPVAAQQLIPLFSKVKALTYMRWHMQDTLLEAP